jgi:CRISPR-associated protein Cas2
MTQKKLNIMWLIVFFDLPVTKKIDRKAAAKFRNFLLNDGYLMLQFSVYARIMNGEERAEKHIERLRQNVPVKGCVRGLKITDLQFNRSIRFVGEKKKAEKRKIATQMTLF